MLCVGLLSAAYLTLQRQFYKGQLYHYKTLKIRKQIYLLLFLSMRYGQMKERV